MRLPWLFPLKYPQVFPYVVNDLLVQSGTIAQAGASLPWSLAKFQGHHPHKLCSYTKLELNLNHLIVLPTSEETTYVN